MSAYKIIGVFLILGFLCGCKATTLNSKKDIVDIGVLPRGLTQMHYIGAKDRKHYFFKTGLMKRKKLYSIEKNLLNISNEFEFIDVNQEKHFTVQVYPQKKEICLIGYTTDRGWNIIEKLPIKWDRKWDKHFTVDKKIIR